MRNNAPILTGRGRMEELKTLTLWFAACADSGAALVIGLATIEATVRAIGAFITHMFGPTPTAANDEKEAIRLRLGRWLALGLEFLLAADILRTAVAPSWTDIGQLAAIVILRIVINYFLQRDIDRVTAQEAAQAAQAARTG
jgi:uncharacterized membrane protein